MNAQENMNYDRIARAIEYIRANFRQQPTLDEIAAQVALSPAHFQRMFTDWAGVSPKKFLQYISIQHARRILLKEKEATLFDAACETGLSGTSRLHDLFVNIEGMTPGQYRNGGEHLFINYHFSTTPFGRVLVASTPRGVCYMAFVEQEEEALQALQCKFPRANYHLQIDAMQEKALSIFAQNRDNPDEIRLHLKGTDFQLKVWEALLKIPVGDLTTYGDLARQLNNPLASRAVGTAVGDNPVAFLIPCHRVIRSSGELGGYHWGLTRKTAMIGWEAARSAADREETE